ncbi:M16 family metallopeptidase [Sphingobium chlorophenolicum]|uniref:Peptidase M16-like protein n=1 Tax=Sphingobium chlorophenolicum TaxID=46429 RepID=A0A081RDX1_SPHCR|nr:M16 family metallopeptidase [Sphingobium chlorophenolicum]KEQ53394.1 Peptidase M16-like protein [Sphingobium chlorophenolicum]
MTVGEKRVRYGTCVRLFLACSTIALGAMGVVEARDSRTEPSAKVQAAPAEAQVPPSQPWAHLASDVPVDPSVRFGMLPNGMGYALLHNATPPGEASLMLRIDAGSLMEKDDQLGLAHFMEHMAFNGTTHIPKTELIAILQRLGLAFGADLNAATSFDQTFYQLQMPRSDAKTLDTGLFVLREQVSEATMDPGAIDEERGVIAGEERLRNSPGLRAAEKQMAVLAKGQKVATRFPIGDLKIINTAKRDRFVDFYNSYYRPSRATLVAVGDFDVDAMEAKVRKTFADWQPKGPDGADPDLGQVAARGKETHIFVEPGMDSSVSLAWTRAPDNAPDRVAKRRDDTLETLALAVLKRRLGEMSRTDDAPFLAATADGGALMRSVQISTIGAQFVQGKWQQALKAIEQEQRRFVTYGVTDAELQREINSTRTTLENAVKSASTRFTRGLSGNLLNTVNSRVVFSSPATNLALFQETTKDLKAADVNAAIKRIFVGGGPILTMTSPVPIEGGEQAVAAALDASQKMAVLAPAAPVKKPWEYTSFGTPGQVVETKQLAELGATIVTFANGTTLTFKRTDFSKDTISIYLLTGAGEQNFSPDKFDPRGLLIRSLNDGGLGKLTVDEMSRALNGHSVRTSLATMGDRFLLVGYTRGRDFQLQMQMMGAYLTDPAFRPTSFEQAKASYPAAYEANLATPATAFRLYAAELLAGGDKRVAALRPEEIANISVEPYRTQLKALLDQGPMHLTIVGDTTLEEAIKVTANTLGALPARQPVSGLAPGADRRAFPAPTAEPLRFTHKGLAEQSLAYIAWPATDATRDLTEARRIELLGAVLKLRVLEEIREKEGLAYAPNVSTEFSDTYKGYGSLAAQAETDPAKLPLFFKAIDAIAQDLRDKPVSADELKRAREPLVEHEKLAQKSNSWWLNKLVYAVDRPWYLPQSMTYAADLEAVQPADIQALARKYLRPELAWKAQVMPEAQVAGAGPKPTGY